MATSGSLKLAVDSPATAKAIEQRTDAAFDELFVKSGVRGTVHHYFIPTEEERIRSGAMRDLGRYDVFPIVEERLNVIWSSVYQMLYRTMLFLLWAPYLALFFLPALIDGLAVRQIKKTNFDYASPMVHRYSIYAILATLYVLLLAMFAPLPIPPVLLPFAGAVIAMMMGLAAANTQKRV